MSKEDKNSDSLNEINNPTLKVSSANSKTKSKVLEVQKDTTHPISRVRSTDESQTNDHNLSGDANLKSSLDAFSKISETVPNKATKNETEHLSGNQNDADSSNIGL